VLQEEKTKLLEAIKNGDASAIRSLVTENSINVNANMSSKVVSGSCLCEDLVPDKKLFIQMLSMSCTRYNYSAISHVDPKETYRQDLIVYSA